MVVAGAAPPATATVGGAKAYDKPITLTYTIEPLGDKKDFPVEGVLVQQTISADKQTTLEILEIKQ